MDRPKILQGNPDEISIVKEPLSYQEFLEKFLRPNKPCLISPHLISSWPAAKFWICSSDGSSSTPNWEYIQKYYGDEQVTVAKCDTRSFSDQERFELPLRDVIELWKSGKGEGLYVKDWHLARSTREKGGESFYETPDIFLDDWMNSFWENEVKKDDFRFVYMGVAGTFTPLHCDVYTSYSWSTNVVGTKIWRLFPPNISHFLRRFPDRTTSEIVYDTRNVDKGVFKSFQKAEDEMIVVEQPVGWTIFIPSGWYHQVENVTDAISINHNWCNINSLPSMYTSLLSAVSDVEEALSDVKELLQTQTENTNWEKEWNDIVQDILKKDSGWDWTIFWRMILLNIKQMGKPPLVSLY
ncbi:hypothetical protein M422DRAFT_181471 [Sphaerobolus stellatus SS14]|uniref:JmjC domain-containing protein n=1 Tax=Sphaerobolus stellatus (strain SS14) TaxID=990650 RepID=A0A0C9VBS7_SPHS4|nr:hypothetical protein M422DRAFT_181471 [Sphaerobolus stellatus SS14]